MPTIEITIGHNGNLGNYNNCTVELVGGAPGGYARFSAQPMNRAFRVDVGNRCNISLFTRHGQDTSIYYEQWNGAGIAPILKVTVPGRTGGATCQSY